MEKILPFATNLHYSNDGFHCANTEATLLKRGVYLIGVHLMGVHLLQACTSYRHVSRRRASHRHVP